MHNLVKAIQEIGCDLEESGGGDNIFEYVIPGCNAYCFYQLLEDLGYEFHHYADYTTALPGTAYQVWVNDGTELAVEQSRYDRTVDVRFWSNVPLE